MACDFITTHPNNPLITRRRWRGRRVWEIHPGHTLRRGRRRWSCKKHRPIGHSEIPTESRRWRNVLVVHHGGRRWRCWCLGLWWRRRWRRLCWRRHTQRLDHWFREWRRRRRRAAFSTGTTRGRPPPPATPVTWPTPFASTASARRTRPRSGRGAVRGLMASPGSPPTATTYDQIVVCYPQTVKKVMIIFTYLVPYCRWRSSCDSRPSLAALDWWPVWPPWARPRGLQLCSRWTVWKMCKQCRCAEIGPFALYDARSLPNWRGSRNW